MKVIVAGSRSITDYKTVCDAIAASGFEITEVVSGHAGMTYINGEWKPSVDRLGERWSAEFLKREPKLFPAKWTEHGKKAGFMRNYDMSLYAEALIAIHANGSKGTEHMIKMARKQGLKVFVVEYKA